MPAHALALQQGRHDRGTHVFVVLTHRVGNLDVVLPINMHVVDILALGAEVVVHHLLETQSYHQHLDLAAEFLGGAQASDSEVTGHLGAEIAQAMTNHDILDQVDRMEEVVAVLGYRSVHHSFLLVTYGIDAHAAQVGDHLLTTQWFAKGLPDLGQRTCHRLLEVIRDCDLLAELCLLGEDYAHREDLKSQVGHVACNDRRCQQQVLEDGAGELDEQIAVTHLDGTDAGAVDHGREAQGIPIVVIQERVDRLVRDNMAILLPLRMLGADLAQRQVLSHPKRHEVRCIGIGTGVVHRELEEIAPVDAHGNGLSLAAEVPAQLLLALDQSQQDGLVDHLPLGCEPNAVRTYCLGLGMDDQRPSFVIEGLLAGGEEIIQWCTPFGICIELTRYTGSRPQVGAVGVVQLDLDHMLSLIMSIELRLCDGEDVLQLGIGIWLVEQAVEQPLLYFNLGH